MARQLKSQEAQEFKDALASAPIPASSEPDSLLLFLSKWACDDPDALDIAAQLNSVPEENPTLPNT
jgi:hypothetical protein